MQNYQNENHDYDESFTWIILPFSITWKAMTGLVPQNAKIRTRNTNHNDEEREKLENSDSDEDSGFIKDKPLKLQMKKKKKKVVLFYKTKKV